MAAPVPARPGPPALPLVALDVPDAGPLRVVVAARDPLVRAALARSLGATFPDADGRTGAADVALWDAGPGPGADDALLGALPPGLPVVALVADAADAPAAWGAGARGLVPREARGETLAVALFAVARGLAALDPALAGALPGLGPRPAGPPADPLTPREREVLALLAEGIPNKLIADRLGVAERTVKYHVAAVFAKLDAHSRTEAVARGVRSGLVVL